MKKLSAAAGASLAVFVPAAGASAKAPTRQHVTQYLHQYHAARHRFGPREVGCNLIGRIGSCHRDASDGDVVKSLAVLDRMLAPPRPVAASMPVARYGVATSTTVPAYTTTTQSPSYTGGGSSGALPYCTWGPESGGNWNAVNPTSGAYGRYQILPSTAAANGCDLGTHQGQTDCASRIWAGGNGRSQWVNC